MVYAVVPFSRFVWAVTVTSVSFSAYIQVVGSESPVHAGWFMVCVVQERDLVMRGRYNPWLRVHVYVRMYTITRADVTPRAYLVHPFSFPCCRDQIMAALHGASNFRCRSRIHISGTRFCAFPPSEPEAQTWAQTVALDLAQKEVTVSLGWKAGPTVGAL